MGEGLEKREVPPPVVGVMSALKSCESWFRAAAAGPPLPFVVLEGSPQAMAQRCAKAIAELEASLEPDPGRPRPKAQASPSLIFRMGYDHGAMKALWDLMSEDAQATKPLPPADWESAWAQARALLAGAK